MNLFMRFEGMDMFLAVKRKRRLSIHMSARELRGQGHLRVNYLEIVFIFFGCYLSTPDVQFPITAREKKS